MRRRLRCAVALLLPLVSPAIPSAISAEAPPARAESWARRLGGLPRDRRLELHLDAGRRIVGYPVMVTADSVVLAGTPGGRPGGAAATDEILAVRREASGALAGWRIGCDVGAVLGTAAGLLLAALVDAIEETGETEPFAYAGMAVGTAAVGATGVGGLGALVGLAGSSWYELEATGPPRRPKQRLGLEMGLAGTSDIADRNYDAMHLRLFLPRRLSDAIDLGPEASWSDLGRSSTTADGRTSRVGDTWSIGLATRISPATTGLAPFAVLGGACYDRDDAWFGLSYGIGLRWRHRSGQEAVAEVRHHIRAVDIDPEPTNAFVSVTIGWTFAP